MLAPLFLFALSLTLTGAVDENANPLHLLIGENKCDILHDLMHESLGLPVEGSIPSDLPKLRPFHYNSADERGDTPLLAAIRRGRIACVAAFLKHGADLSVTDVSGLGPLDLAAMLGEGDIIRLIIREPHAPFRLVGGLFPPHRTLTSSTVTDRHVDALAAFFENGIDPSLRDGEGRTLVQLAAGTPAASVVDAAVRRKAERGAKMGQHAKIEAGLEELREKRRKLTLRDEL